MPSHIFALRPTTKFSAKSFVFRNNGAKEGLKKDNPSGLGAGGRGFCIFNHFPITCCYSLCRELKTANHPSAPNSKRTDRLLADAGAFSLPGDKSVSQIMPAIFVTPTFS